MAKQKPPTPAEDKAVQALGLSSQQPAEAVSEPVDLRETAELEQSDEVVYRVAIPNSLAGPRLIAARSEAEALDRYRAECGIIGHKSPAVIEPTDIRPADVQPGPSDVAL